MASSSSFGENSISNYVKIQNIGNYSHTLSTATRFGITGKGTYGQVYKAKDNKTKQIVAIKKINNVNELENEGFPSTSIREISILRELDHRNIIQLKDVVIQQKQLYLIFEYVERDLKSYLETLDKDKYLEPLKIKKILYQLLAGIADCHVKRIIHRDLKPANILVDKNGIKIPTQDNVKIADFGLARTYSIPARPYSQEVVTLWYRAPQILLGSLQYSTPIDIWSIGCIFAEIATKKPLFAGDSEVAQLYKIFRILGTPSNQVWPGVTTLRDYKDTFPNWSPNAIQDVVSNLNLCPLGIDLLNRMLKYDPNVRITAKAAMQHPYFKDLNKEEL